VLERHYISNEAGDAILNRSGDETISTYTGLQVVGQWDDGRVINGGVWTTIDLGFNWQLADDLKFDFVRQGVYAHTEEIPVHLIISGKASDGLAHYQTSVYHRVQSVSETEIRMQVFNETQAHKVERITGIANAANGFV